MTALELNIEKIVDKIMKWDWSRGSIGEPRKRALIELINKTVDPNIKVLLHQQYCEDMKHCSDHRKLDHKKEGV